MRTLMRLPVVMVAVLGFLLLGNMQAQAQTFFTLSHNGWEYKEDMENLGIGAFVDPDGIDHMHQNWWWFRTNLDSSERRLVDLLPGSTVGPNSATVRFRESVGSDPVLFVELTYTLTGLSSTQAKVDINWRVLNIARESLTVNFFSYSDFELNGSSLDDRGELVNPHTVRYVQDNTAVDVVASTTSLVGYDVGAYPSLLDLLNDTSEYNVSNSGLPFGPGDMTNVFQWSFDLAAQSELRGSLTKLVNLQYSPPQQPVIPEPGTWALMLSGLVPVALRLRRKS